MVGFEGMVTGLGPFRRWPLCLVLGLRALSFWLKALALGWPLA